MITNESITKYQIQKPCKIKVNQKVYEVELKVNQYEIII